MFKQSNKRQRIIALCQQKEHIDKTCSIIHLLYVLVIFPIQPTARPPSAQRQPSFDGGGILRRQLGEVLAIRPGRVRVDRTLKGTGGVGPLCSFKRNSRKTP